MKTDSKILKSIASGDKKAFNEFYMRYVTRTFNLALHFSGNKELAEEITQDVFVKVFRYAANFKGQSAVQTWLYRITSNTALTYLKRQNKLKIFSTISEKTEHVFFNHPGVLLENKEKASHIYAALNRLSERQRSVFVLCYIQDLPQKEVADILELSLKATESLLQRAKGNLRKHLKENYPNRRK